MTEMDIPFIYESMTFSRPSGKGRYTPDFFLPRQQIYIELKPCRPHLEEEAKLEEMSLAGFRVVLIYGENIGSPPFRTEADAKRTSGCRDYGHKNALRGMAWMNGEKLAGDTVFVCGPNPRGSSLEAMGDLDLPHLDQISNTRDLRWNDKRILDSLKSGGDKRFE